MKNFKLFLLVITVIGVSLAASTTVEAQTAPICTFTRDLEVGLSGADVLCLQKFLNSNGFTIASSGIGSPGEETSLFGGLTREALAKWQAAQGISPATGYFGAKTRTAVVSGSTGTMATPTAAAPATSDLPTIPELVAKLTEYKDIITNLQQEKENLESGSGEENDIRDLLREARELIEDAEDRIDDADSDEDLAEMEDDLDDATEDLVDGLYAFLDEDYSKAETHAEDAIETAQDIIEELGGDQDDAEDAIDDAKEAISDAKDEIWDADDEGSDVDEAEDLLDDAKDKLDDAEEAFDDEDYDDAIEAAQEAEDLADQAVDAIED